MTCPCCGRGPLAKLKRGQRTPPGHLRAVGDMCGACDQHTRRGETPKHYFLTHPRLDHAAVLEDVAFMAEHGESMEGAARRVGIQRDSLLNLLTKKGATDVRDRLLAREWRVTA